MTKKRIGFSGAASVASASFARSLKQLGFSAGGHDYSNTISLNPELDFYRQSPRADQPLFYDFLKEFIDSECDFYIPFLDEELLVCKHISAEDARLAKKMLLCSLKAIKTSRDKKLMKQTAEALGIPCVRDTTCAPAHIKPRFSTGGKHSLAIHDNNMVTSLLSDAFLDAFMVEELMTGLLVSVDGLWGNAHNLISSFSRVRSFSSGVSTLSTKYQDERQNRLMQHAITCIGSNLGFCGMCSVQFIIGEDSPLLLEVNPRLGGSAMHSHFLGSDIIVKYLEMLTGTQIDAADNHQATVVSRFFYDRVY